MATQMFIVVIILTHSMRNAEEWRMYAQGAGNANDFAVLVPRSQLGIAGDESEIGGYGAELVLTALGAYASKY